jgi:hypothetical protein
MVQAQKDFETASLIFPKGADRLRCRMHAAECLLARQEKVFALKLLREAAKDHATLPQAKAVNMHIERLDPKPPAPAADKKP